MVKMWRFALSRLVDLFVPGVGILMDACDAIEVVDVCNGCQSCHAYAYLAFEKQQQRFGLGVDLRCLKSDSMMGYIATIMYR
jgi:hypothetical protein